MDGEWVADRTVHGETADEETAAEPDENLRPASLPALQPEGCRAFMRAEVANALRGIVAALIQKAQEGSITHAKGLIELSGLDEVVTVSRQEKSLEQILLEQWEKDAIQRGASVLPR
jgi:hypothetical protein